MKKTGFSLIELLIVIVIIGVVYTLSISGFKNINKKEEEKLSFENLKSYMMRLKHNNSVSIVCKKGSDECEIFADSKEYKTIEDFLDGDIEIFRYDSLYGMTPLQRNDDVAFSLTLNKMGISEQIFVKYKQKVYDFTKYIGKTPVYDSLQEAADAQEKMVSDILR